MPHDPKAQGSLIIGPLDAEREWIPAGVQFLGACLNDSLSQHATRLDHLLVLVARQSDYLITVGVEDASISKNLESCGFGCKTSAIFSTHFPPSNWSFVSGNRQEMVALAVDSIGRSGIRFKDVLPYAVTPYTRQVALQLCPYTNLPEIAAVREVNSKVWSSELRKKLGLPDANAKCVENGTELKTACRELLKAGPVIIKDSFGVAGSGSVVVESVEKAEATARLVDHLCEKGSMSLVVEEYLPKKSDLSAQLLIAETGSIKVIGFCETVMDGRTPIAIKAYSDVLSEPKMAAFRDVCVMIAGHVYSAGYWGPLCIDSMELVDGSLFPLVEINARMSLGSAVLAGITKLSNGYTDWTLRRLKQKVPISWSSAQWIALCRQSGCLYPDSTSVSVVPLACTLISPSIDNLNHLVEFWWIEGWSSNAPVLETKFRLPPWNRKSSDH